MNFFDVSYSVGNQITELLNTDDEKNKTLAVSMMFGAVKEKIKSEIIEELKKK